MQTEIFPCHSVQTIRFSVYTDEEIRKISVKELTNVEAFDTLNHPTYGGLHDPALGPNDLHDICQSCNLPSGNCPGHLGHITLPLPVYNPMLFRTMVSLVRLVCFSCHRLRLPAAKKLIFAKQMQAIDLGLVFLVEQLQEVANEIYHDSGEDSEGENVCEEELETRLSECYQNAIEDLDMLEAEKNAHVRHVVEVRSQLLQNFLKYNRTNKSCPLCKAPVRSVSSEYHARLYLNKSSSRRQAIRYLASKKKEEESRVKTEEDGNTDYEDVEMEDGTTAQEEDDQNDVTGDATEPKVKEKKATDLFKEIELQKVLGTSLQYLNPEDIRSLLRQVWVRDSSVLSGVLGVLKRNSSPHPTDIFFLTTVPVTPPVFRPCMRIGGIQSLHGQTKSLKMVLEQKKILQMVLKEMQNVDEHPQALPSEEADEVLKRLGGSSLSEKLNTAWLLLQTKVNAVVDSDLDKLNYDAKDGVKQILEKKEGLFRQNMMGKRVNYAARSVITPDPYIATNEIGIPEVFAHKLTYPQPVTPWNFHELKQAVINGPLVRPGATRVICEDGMPIMLKPHDKTQREAIAKQLLTPSNNPQNHIYPCKLVYRHLKNGDVLLLNRQPTLHRPSIQAHKARVLPKEKTLRLHYANCKAYNADFDGDEMNAHFPQDEISRSEAYNLVSTDNNYLVPKDGTPLAGLIQDHMISGVHLTMRGRFFTRDDYHELVFRGLTDKDGKVTTLPPSILKPQLLWSGKQVLSTVLLNIIPKGKKRLSLFGSSKVGNKDWQNRDVSEAILNALDLDIMGESMVVIRHGELLQGVLDKGHYGNTPYGLVHCCYELYGGAVAGQLLTCLARLFTSFLQTQGFTLGVEDILATKKADKRRRKILKEVQKCERKVLQDALQIDHVKDDEDMLHKLREAHFHDDGNALKDIDLCMKGQTDEFQNAISKVIMPVGLQKRFPHNNLQLMVQSGAKGSTVNCVQISCLLGQIELEGRRPPLMISGQTLPSFLPYDLSPRAGGFVGGRFLTGIRPQEYFFHCMAGREGLIDTAVKTSRSGYLQRCIIKHLEGLTVNYDLTIRDSDNSVIQFQYGEDGLEIQKTQFLIKKQFPFLIGNKDVFTASGHLEEVQRKVNVQKAPKLWKKLKKQRKKQIKAGSKRSSPFLNFCNEHWDEVIKKKSAVDLISKKGRSPAVDAMCSKWAKLNEEEKQGYAKLKTSVPDPVSSVISQSNNFGAVTERMDALIENYIEDNPHGLVEDAEEESSKGRITQKSFRNLMYLRSMQALVEPGEAVGLIAAQSIGEPSTQMTLNTFHFAGRGEMNVTLGIPRLREILMVASQTIKTPTMDIPLIQNASANANGQKLKLELTRVMLSEVIEKVTVNEVFRIRTKMDTSREFKIKFHFLPYEFYENDFNVDPTHVLYYMEEKFFKALTNTIHRRMAELDSMSMVSSGKVVQRASRAFAKSKPVDEDVEDDDQHDDDATATKFRQKQMEDVDYEGEDEEREEVGDEKDEEAEEAEEDDDDPNSPQDSQEKVEGEEEEETGTSSVSATPKATPKATPMKSSRRKFKGKKLSKDMRINRVLSEVAINYSYDVKEELWCEITMKFPLRSKHVDLPSLIHSLAKRSVVYEVANIKRCFLSQSKKPGEEGIWRIKTEGINLQEIMKYAEILDLNKLYTNDIHAIANQYGLEAAGRALVQEVRDVFAGYGIEVNYRHLSLIADYMTFEGSYKPLNRIGIEFNASPLQKMTFETTMRFLKQATLEGASDDLKSPSARLVTGGLVNVGGGVFDLLQPLK